MRLSIVSTMYRSAPYLREFHARVSQAAGKRTDDYEIILVNDGSPDDSLALALPLQADRRTRIVDLSRNFGHHPAMMTGLAHARGERVFLIDCDLEEAPEVLETFAAHMDETGADVVYGIQDSRQGNWFRRVSGGLFYRLFNLLSSDPIPPDVLTVRLMTRRYVEALLQHREVQFVISGLWQRTGFEQLAVPVRKSCRKGSTYTLARRLALFVNAVTSFSGKPLVWIFYLGAILFGLSSLAAFGLIVRRLFGGPMQDGWSSLMVTIWLLGGLIVFCQGLIGIYLAKIFMEVKRRPLTIVRQVYEPGQEGLHGPVRLAG